MSNHIINDANKLLLERREMHVPMSVFAHLGSISPKLSIPLLFVP